MDYLLEREQYARIYGCTARSVSNYERDAAPLDEPEAMYHWLWNRRTQPAGFTGKTVEDLASAYARATATGTELDTFLRRDIVELVEEMDLCNLRVRCKLLAAEKAGYTPVYKAAIFGAMNKALDGVQEVYDLWGLHEDDEDPDEED